MDKVITMKEQIYDIIKHKIADGTYKHGQRFFEKELSVEFNVSRSPVREVIKQLVIEGVLDESPNKGASLKVFSEKEISDIFSFRALVECYAIDFIQKNNECFPHDKLSIMHDRILTLNGEPIDYVVETQINPHNVFVRATRNNYTIEMHRRASFCTMSYHNVLFEGKNYEKNVSQHLAIVDNLLAKDFPGAKKVLMEHLDFSQEIICAAIHKRVV